MDTLALLSPSPDTGTRLTYTDTPPASPASPYYYLVEAYNSAGQVWSALSEPITPACSEGSALHPAERALAVEALNITVRDSYDRLYCYVSLVGSSFERIPHGASEFIQMDSGAWNIADYASGRNKRAIITNGSRPLEIIVECLGWQGGTLVNLGRFTRSHPPEEWDGRLLTAGPADGSFSVTYRIEPTEEVYGHGGGGDDGAWPLIDPRIPAPYDLLKTASWSSCTRSAEDFITCATVDEPGLTWEYTVFEGAPRPPLFYRVYKRLESESVPRVYFDTIGIRKSASLDNSGERAFYSVSAVVGRDPLTGEEIQSPFSEELEVPPLTGTLRITLVNVWSVITDDDMEAYGWLWFNGQRVTWNDHCDCGLSGYLAGAPSYTTIEVGRYNWADMFLNQGDGWRRRNNVILLPITDGEPLRMGLQFLDHDQLSSDDVWCALGRSGITLLEGRSMDDWRLVDQEIHVGQSGAPYYDLAIAGCAVDLRVQGMP